MKQHLLSRYLIFAVTLVLLSACQLDSDAVDGANNAASATNAETPLNPAGKDGGDHTTKLQPPVTVDYHILGTPAVGEPLEIEITVSSDISDVPIQVDYRAADRDALRFLPENGDRQSFKLANANRPGTRNIVVVPQRAGRNRFVVTTQLQMPDGIMANSRALVIQVGDAPLEKQINGELLQDENGEAVISMPADQR